MIISPELAASRQRVDAMMAKIDAQREARNREADLPHPDSRMAYRWTYPCKRCKQMMRVSWDSSNREPGSALYHNCENMVDADDGETLTECGAYHVFPLDWYIQVDLRAGRLSCERTDEPLAECLCADCIARRAIADEPDGVVSLPDGEDSGDRRTLPEPVPAVE